MPSRAPLDGMVRLRAMVAQDSNADGVGPGAADATPSARPRGSTRAVLNSIGEALYEWNLETDRLFWSENASRVFETGDLASISTGARYEALVDRESMTNRSETIRNGVGIDQGEGVPYDIDYALLIAHDGEMRTVWVQDRGRWFADESGKPVFAHGAVRVTNYRHEQEQRLAFQSRYDAQTGHLNRLNLLETLEHTLQMSVHYGMPLSFLAVSIDNLHIANEAYGFEAADKIVVAIGRRIAEILGKGETIGRISGSGFGMILRRETPEEAERDAHELVERLQSGLIETEVGPVAPMISGGLVHVPEYAQTLDQCLARALEAQEMARQNGPGYLSVFQPCPTREAYRRENITIAEDMLKALNERRLVLAQQPVFRTSDRSEAFRECLLRVLRDDGETVTLGRTITIAEKLGLVRLIDIRVLELVFEALKTEPLTHFSFNISADTARDGEWIAMLEAGLAQRPDFADRLIIELTETALIRDIDEIRAFVSRVRALGCRVALDDFGAGYTSFRNLKLLEVDIIKIDGSFIRQLAENRDDEVFVRTLIELSRSFQLETVAEMIETEQTVAILKRLGVDYLQGYHLGYPRRMEGPAGEGRKTALAG